MTNSQFPEYLIKLGNTLYSTTQPNEYVQRSTYIKEYSDNCIQPLVAGKTSKCTTIKSLQTTTQFLTDNLVLINNARENILQSNCGPDDRNITGNILISFANCSITFRNQTFSSTTKQTRTTILQGAMHNLFMDQQPEEDILKIINNMSLTNREKIDHVYLMQFNSKLWDWSLLGGISVSMILTITISVLAFLTYRKSLYKILSKIAKRKKTRTPSPGNHQNQDA